MSKAWGSRQHAWGVGGLGLSLAAFGLSLAALGCGSGDARSAAGLGESPAGAGAQASTSAGAASGGGAPSSPEPLDPSTVTNGAAPPGSAAPAEPSAGCGAPAALVASGARSIDVDGVERTYVLDVPAAHDGTRPYPLVFAFHGATTSGALFRSRFYADLLSAMEGEAIVVHADALGSPTAWDAEADVPFFDALLAQLEAAACVDRARVFATGHSSGGFFTNALGCQRGDVLRAIAPVSGGGPFAQGCSGGVAVWLAHGEDDDVVPFESGLRSLGRWREANGCSEAAAAAEPAPCVQYQGCAEGLPVRWCVYRGGHDWPEFGPEGIWGFFGSL